ncbi:hypothetical protein [Herpetosiphon giganteus]|uniref:hypothetical protein n=1 Tax=Herpetosiphon giganteus TaxID=2029754 RepID=UPI00195DB0AF|nr:hypothetical protein [Herpetosiphon giganteus]MBM7844874.1 putative iron-regulated membrane protein [Herpetosiphon giganteus]
MAKIDFAEFNAEAQRTDGYRLWAIGWPTKIIAVLTCLILIGLSISGVLLWWWRRPKSKLGMPGRVNEQVVPKWMVAVIVVLSIFMPLMGVSLLLVLFGDWGWRRWQRSRNNQPA